MSCAAVTLRDDDLLSAPCGARAEPTIVLEHALMVERHHAEWFAAERVVPGTEIHRNRDVTWVVHPGDVWRNAGIMLRFRAATAARRLDTLIARYQAHGRGMALWVSPTATPDNLPGLLTARRLRCQKYFPAMVRLLSAMRTAPEKVTGLEIRRVEDVAIFEKMPHPAIGPLTTPLRRHALERLRTLSAEPTERSLAFVAWLDGRPVGASELFLGSQTAGLHSLTVPDEYRGRGIGFALVEHTCWQAVQMGASTMALLASSDGQRVYQRCGFSEVARFGCWYRSFQRR